MNELRRANALEKRTTLYRPQRNGLVEGTDRTIISLLEAFAELGTDWDLELPLQDCILSLGTFTHKPNAKLSLDVTENLNSNIHAASDRGEPKYVLAYISSLRNTIRRTKELAYLHLQEAQRRRNNSMAKKNLLLR